MSKKKLPKFSSADYIEPDRETINAGDITEEGFVCIIERAPEPRDGDYGPYWSLAITKVTGKGEEVPAVINYGGKRLHQLLTDVIKKVVGKKVLFQGFEQDFPRFYEISLLGD